MKKKPALLDADSASSISLAAETAFSEHGIVSRTLLTTASLRVTLFGFSAGQELTEHTSSSRAIIQILSGTSAWSIEGQPLTLMAGDILHLPPGMRHAVRADDAFSMLLTLVREEQQA